MNLDKLKGDIEQRAEGIKADSQEMSAKDSQTIAIFQAAYGANPDQRMKAAERAKGAVVLPLILEAVGVSEKEWNKRVCEL